MFVLANPLVKTQIPIMETKIIVIRESAANHSIGHSQEGELESQAKYGKYPHHAKRSVAFPTPRGQEVGYYWPETGEICTLKEVTEG